MNVRTLAATVSADFDAIVPHIHPVLTAAEQRSRCNVGALARRLNAALDPHRVVVDTEESTTYLLPSTRPTSLYPAIGGYCYRPTGELPARIQLVLCVHPSSRRFTFDAERWGYFRFKLYRTLIHELIHRAQYALRPPTNDALIFRPTVERDDDKDTHHEQQYLGDIDEVEAYARNCVEDWAYLFPDVPLTARALRTDFLGLRSVSANKYYYDAYRGDIRHPAVRRYFQKVRAWKAVVTPFAHMLPPCPSFVRGHFQTPPDYRD